MRLEHAEHLITFIDLTFSPAGLPASAVVAKLQTLPGVSSVVGEHDLMFTWDTPSEFDEQIRKIHSVLAGTGATYRVFTVADSYQARDFSAWIPSDPPRPTSHPAYRDDVNPSEDPPSDEGNRRPRRNRSA
ncbi:MAG TPA: hypothetical protein VGX00_02075 [Thermoplasmata archaeon]|nr:hypothetical protein [Thermoplasmata archaeon]